jgi:hypothetical protein
MILLQLSSQSGDRTEQSNLHVARRCMEDPGLLVQIEAGLGEKNAALVGDCAEVMTMVAQSHPELVAPYADSLAPLLWHTTTRVRWEAMHALALVASLTPAAIHALLPRLEELIHSDPSVIARDYAVEALGGYASTGREAARQAYPPLQRALTAWNGKHAARALHGLAQVAANDAAPEGELEKIASAYEDHARPSVRKAARALRKQIRD